MKGVWVSENLQKLIGVVVMAVLVVVGVAVSSGDDTDFSRNRSFRDNPATFSGADRVEEADCCDENAYRISKLENEVALLKGNYEALADGSIQYTLGAYPPAPPSVQTVVDALNENCSGSPQTKLNCYSDYLAGFEIEFARQVVISQGEFGFLHRYEKSGGDKYAKITEEACGPVFYGYGPPPRWALMADSIDGILASYPIGVLVPVASKQGAKNKYSSWESFFEHSYDDQENPCTSE